jgi:solute carrier family 25 carnitine/acylcarnitine transporter 20/29
MESYYWKIIHEIEDEIEEIAASKNFKLLVSGMMTGVCNSFVVTPSDQIKIQVQSGQSNSMLKSLSQVYQTGGIRNGVYRGWQASVCREILYYGSYFISYEYYRQVLSHVNPFYETPGKPSSNIFHPATIFNTLMAGGLAGCTSWIVNMPADYIKSRLQSDSIERPKYHGIVDCAKKSYAAHGTLKVFYTGLVPTLVRAFPVHATILLSYELLKNWM